MTSQVIQSSGRNTVPTAFLDSSKARVIVTNHVERSSFHLEEPQKNKRNFNFNLSKSLSFMARRDQSSFEEIAPEGIERNLVDRRAWLRIEREKARKELRLDQEGDATETTTASEHTSFDSTPKYVSPLRTSSYSTLIALHLPPTPPFESPRRRDGKARRGRRSQVREIVADEVTVKEDGASLLSSPRGELRHSKGNHHPVAEGTSVKSPVVDSEGRDPPKSTSRRPRRRSVGPGHRDRKDGTATSQHVSSCETPSRRPRRRSQGPSRRQLRPLDLTCDDATPAIKSSKKSPSSRERNNTNNFDLPEDEPKITAQRRNGHPSSSPSRVSIRKLSESSEEPPASPRRRLQTRKVKKMNIHEE